MTSLDTMLFGYTRFTTICPKCGFRGLGKWTSDQNIVRCRKCKETFDYRDNTWRPVTCGMSEEERREHYRAWQKAYDSTPERREHNRRNSRRYYAIHRDEINRKRREEYARRRAS